MPHAHDILAAMQDQRVLLQEFVPLAECLDWRLGQMYWRQAGAGAFLSDHVPTRVISDGNLSAGCAEIFFTSLLAADGRCDLHDPIEALEAGTGSGLFARYFLDEFRSICRSYKKNYYDRLVFTAADASQKMLDDIARRDVLGGHEGHYRLERADAFAPSFGLDPQRRFHWIGFNYVLDVLPATILRLDGEDLLELRMSTSYARGVHSIERSLPSADEVRRIVQSGEAERLMDLTPIFPYLLLNHRFEKIDPGSVPFVYSLLASTPPGKSYAVHNYGAACCLQTAAAMLHPSGCIHIADYNPSESDDALDLLYRHEHYGGSTAIGLNFAMLAHSAGAAQLQWVEPEGPNKSIELRLVGRGIAPAVVDCFRRRFGAESFAWRGEPVVRARKLALEGASEAALSNYREAVERQPRNWALLGEIGRFALDIFNDPAAALALAEEGISINPIDPPLRVLRADALLAGERYEDAELSARYALELDSKSLGARFSLARALRLLERYAEALAVIAEALAIGGGGAKRDALLAEQQTIVATLSWRLERRAQLLQGRLGGEA